MITQIVHFYFVATALPLLTVSLYDSFWKCLFKSLVGSFTTLEVWGLYAICNFHLIFRPLYTCWIKSVTKGRAIVWSYTGREPKSGGYFSKQTASHFICFFSSGGEASTHPEKVHTMSVGRVKSPLRVPLTVFLEVLFQGQHWPFSFLVAFLLQPAGLGLGYTVGQS